MVDLRGRHAFGALRCSADFRESLIEGGQGQETAHNTLVIAKEPRIPLVSCSDRLVTRLTRDPRRQR